MILVQFSAAKGPDECCLAVAKAVAQFTIESVASGLSVDVLEQEYGRFLGTLHSVVIMIDGALADTLIQRWQGTILWVCRSPYRPEVKRKNWFIGVSCLAPMASVAESEIRFETTKSSGAGGQHVNKTESAVRATHILTGITVKVQSERSQHANKRMANVLLAHKLSEYQNYHQQQHKIALHQRHQSVERGDARRVFYGEKFVER